MQVVEVSYFEVTSMLLLLPSHLAPNIPFSSLFLEHPVYMFSLGVILMGFSKALTCLQMWTHTFNALPSCNVCDKVL
jgi:hypothetical protein